VIEVFAREQTELWIAPILLDGLIVSKFIAVPGRKDKPGGEFLQKRSERRFVFSGPGIEVINVPSGIGGIRVDKVARCNGSERLAKILSHECPLGNRKHFGDAPNLVRDLRNVCLGEPIRFVPKRHIESAGAIESHHAIEAGAIEEEKIEGGRICVKPLSDDVVVAVPQRSQSFPFTSEKIFDERGSHEASLNLLIEANNMYVRIGK